MTRVLGGGVVERGQVRPVLVEFGHRLGVLGVELLAEALEHGAGVGARRMRLAEPPLFLLAPRSIDRGSLRGAADASG